MRRGGSKCARLPGARQGACQRAWQCRQQPRLPVCSANKLPVPRKHACCRQTLLPGQACKTVHAPCWLRLPARGILSSGAPSSQGSCCRAGAAHREGVGAAGAAAVGSALGAWRQGCRHGQRVSLPAGCSLKKCSSPAARFNNTHPQSSIHPSTCRKALICVQRAVVSLLGLAAGAAATRAHLAVVLIELPQRPVVGAHHHTPPAAPASGGPGSEGGWPAQRRGGGEPSSHHRGCLQL